jgi:hypothetical protein
MVIVVGQTAAAVSSRLNCVAIQTLISAFGNAKGFRVNIVIVTWYFKVSAT